MSRNKKTLLYSALLMSGLLTIPATLFAADGVTTTAATEGEEMGQKRNHSPLYKSIQGEKLTYNVITPDPIMGSTATVIRDGNRAFLIDTQFSKEDADKIIQYIKSQGLTLEGIYISHGDPDYYFGLPFIQEAFPKAKAYATKETINHINSTVANKLQVWKETLKENAPTSVTLPEAVVGEVQFGEHTFKIVGKDPKRTSLFNEADKILLGGISVSADSHLFIADTQSRASQESWIADLVYLESLKPKIVIPGHFGAGNSFSPENLTFSKAYLERFLAESEKAQNSAQLIEAMKRAYPNLDDGALELSAKVIKGEEKWD